MISLTHKTEADVLIGDRLRPALLTINVEANMDDHYIDILDFDVVANVDGIGHVIDRDQILATELKRIDEEIRDKILRLKG